MLRTDAEVAELADAHGSGPCGRNTLWVRLPSSACRLGAGNLDFIGFPATFIIVTDGTFGSFIAESVFLLAGYILSNQSDYTLIHNTGVSEYQYPDVVSCYPCNFLIVFSAFLCERITD